MNKKRTLIPETLRLAFGLFSCFILSGIIVFIIIFILTKLNVNFFKTGPLLFSAAILLSCIIVSIILVTFRTKEDRKFLSSMNDCFEKLSHGDFSSKIPEKYKNKLYQEIAVKINTVVNELNSSSVLKKDFIKNFSHEFNTPIASIKGFSEILVTDSNLSNDEKLKYYQIIFEESTRLANLSNMTLFLSKLNTDSVIIKKEAIYIDESIEECALLLYNEITAKNIEVIFDIEHIKIEASKELLKELWINIINNAIKYSNFQSKLKIFSYETTDSQAICFQDYGIGMNNETINHIFDEYYQGDRSHSKHGIGLGLSICKKICDIHNWNITVKSIENQGTTFTVIIPK